MIKRKTSFSILGTMVVLVLALGGMIFRKSTDYQVAFLDVGQGDAILISHGSWQVLIDGGTNEKVILEKLGRYISFDDRTIEVLIVTHPDQDHLGGLIGVLENYEIGKIIDNGEAVDSEVYKKYIETIEEKQIERIDGQAGTNVRLTEEAELKIIYAKEGDTDRENNSESLVSKLTIGNFDFLLTGDLPSEEEEKIGAMDLAAEVLKVGHHGSKYSTSYDFLERVNPGVAIISVAEKNRYQHPAEETLKRLKDKGVEIWRTDVQGDIIYSCQEKKGACSPVIN